MNRKISFGAALALLLIVAALVISITMNYATASYNSRVNDLRGREVMYEKYTEVDNLVRQNYNGTINETQLMNSVAQGYLQGLDDQYGRYISAEEYKKMMRETGDGENVGIGAVIAVAPDDFYLEVLEVYPDSPAEVAGIQAGDLIIKIDDTELSRENSREMLEAISGSQGSNITLVTRRGSEENPPVQMTRRSVPVPTVLYDRILEDSGVGYLHISEFRERTYDQFNRVLLSLQDQGATSLIIDLRDNASDYLKSAARIMDKLLPEGVLVSASYKNGDTEVLASSDANAVDIPVVLLVNNGTTGVPELFAQTVKDFERGKVVGSTTAGKGVMQKILSLSDGSAIELSVANYLTHNGEPFHKVGIKPDFDVQQQQERNWRELESEYEDQQLIKAKEVAISLTKASGNGEEQPRSQADETPWLLVESQSEETENEYEESQESTAGDEGDDE